MIGAILRRMYALVVPGGVLLAATVAFLQWAEPATVTALVRLYPYAVLLAGLLLGWRFNRLSVVFALLALAAADRALFYFVAGSAEMSDVGRTVFQATALLLPLNLAGFSLLSERGTLAERGVAGVATLAGQGLAVGALAWLAPAGGAELWEHDFVEGYLAAWTPVSQPALAAFAAALAVIGVRCVLNRRALDNGFLWATVAAFLALHTGGGEALLREQLGSQVATVYFSTAGLVLVFAVVEASYAMAYRDELTRLPARRALNEALEQVGGDYAVAMVDVDHFKKFNDTYGHEVGDQVLQMVASRLQEIGGGGKAFRYGGEEFCVLFAGRTEQEALPHLEEMRQAVEQSEFTLRGPDRPKKAREPARLRAARAGSRKKVSVTVSIGVASPSERRETPEEVVQAADKALYRAKKAGRNQVRT